MARFRGFWRPLFDKDSARKGQLKDSARNLVASDSNCSIELDAASQEDLVRHASAVSPASSESIPLAATQSGSSSGSSDTGTASSTSNVGGYAPCALTLKHCKCLTNNFSETDGSFLGEGSFGRVHLCIWKIRKGTPSEMRVAVAVKRLKAESHQGIKEWKREVEHLGRLRHPNLVKLLAYCDEEPEAVLVYEFCPNGSVDAALFPAEGESQLTWRHRVAIAKGVANGLAFLHSENVIHRDFKSANVLLARDMSARITDFGLARQGPEGDNTHVTTERLGTLGYRDPSYMIKGHLTYASDVYGYGILLLELLTGRPAVIQVERVGSSASNECLIDWAKPRLQDIPRRINELMDEGLRGQWEADMEAAARLAKVAYCCTRSEHDKRPTMNEVVERLNKVTLQEAARNE